ncbi:MAG: hypothetical protein DME97_12185 [Verrucomicrobia bacterium]|nr:MAG: hypothetical protein DME97_12185 [Verrucomicrobiota bacterium]
MAEVGARKITAGKAGIALARRLRSETAKEKGSEKRNEVAHALRRPIIHLNPFFPCVDFSLTGAIGGYSAAHGSISGPINDNCFGDDHGAEWKENIQHLSQFFDEFIHQLDL